MNTRLPGIVSALVTGTVGVAASNPGSPLPCLAAHDLPSVHREGHTNVLRLDPHSLREDAGKTLLEELRRHVADNLNHEEQIYFYRLLLSRLCREPLTRPSSLTGARGEPLEFTIHRLLLGSLVRRDNHPDSVPMGDRIVWRVAALGPQEETSQIVTKGDGGERGTYISVQFLPPSSGTLELYGITEGQLPYLQIDERKPIATWDFPQAGTPESIRPDGRNVGIPGALVFVWVPREGVSEEVARAAWDTMYVSPQGGDHVAQAPKAVFYLYTRVPNEEVSAGRPGGDTPEEQIVPLVERVYGEFLRGLSEARRVLPGGMDPAVQGRLSPNPEGSNS